MQLFEQGSKIYFNLTPVNWRGGINKVRGIVEGCLGINLKKEPCYVVFMHKNCKAIRVMFYRHHQLFLLETRLINGEAFPQVQYDDRNRPYVNMTRKKLQYLMEYGKTFEHVLDIDDEEPLEDDIKLRHKKRRKQEVLAL